MPWRWLNRPRCEVETGRRSKRSLTGHNRASAIVRFGVMLLAVGDTIKGTCQAPGSEAMFASRACCFCRQFSTDEKTVDVPLTQHLRGFHRYEVR